MEAFSLLKYWRSNGGGFAATAKPPRAAAKSIVSPSSSDGEDGPYFDLEFALPNDENDQKALETDKEDEIDSESDTEEEISVQENDEDNDDEAELKFALTNTNCRDQKVRDELFCKGDLVSIEPSIILSSEENSKLPVFLVKSATKFRVLLLKLKKSKSTNGVENLDKAVSGGNKLLAVKLKIEEVPLVSLFTRDNSSKEVSSHGSRESKQNVENISDHERKVTKEVVHKYLKMVKPFYVRVSKLKLKAPAPPCAAEQGNGSSNLQAGLKAVRKSRSASAVAAAAVVTSNRRDDSLLQVQDGIQGAILHCKRSFNASRDVESSSILSRSVSDPSYEKSLMMPKASSSSSSSGEAKESKI